MKAFQQIQEQGEVGTGRLETLTDGIFAIAMTILVFGLSIPDVAAVALPAALGRLWPNLLSLIVSFVILGVYWVATHNEFRYIRRADHMLIWLNIFFLLAVSLVPFSAGLLGHYPTVQLAVILYGANLLACLCFHAGMWWHATRANHLVDADLDPATVSLGKRLALFPIIGYGLAIGVSFVNTWISLLLYALVPVPYILGLFYRGLGTVRRGDNEGKASSDYTADEQAGSH